MILAAPLGCGAKILDADLAVVRVRRLQRLQIAKTKQNTRTLLVYSRTIWY